MVRHIRCWWMIAWLAFPGYCLEVSEPRVIAVIAANNGLKQSLDKDELSRIFLRKTLLWANGEPIQPVNLTATHPLRRLFSERVFGLEPEELDNYWNAQYFHGVFPPYSVASEEAVLRYVAALPNAIGYVSACTADHRVSVLFYLTPTGLARTGNPALHCHQ